MAATQTVGFSDIEPAEGRKFLSKHRNVQLPLEKFEDRDHNGAEFVPFTPINQALRATHNQSTDTLSPQKVVKFRIYMSRVESPAISENGIDLNIESGKTADSKTLLFYLAKEYDIDYQAFSEMFAIWMISPLLEVQLKSYHRPYECRQGWETLLNRFVDVPNGRTLTSDEPILMLRRNASLTSDREFELLNHYPQCAHFLIIDAREMLLLGRLHFLSLDDTIRVAALLFCLQHGNFKEQTHDVAFIRNNIEEILPERTCESIAAKTIFGKAISKKTAQEERLLNCWKECSKYRNDTEKEHELLMTLTQTSSCYGAAWFSGRIEKKTSRASLRNFGQSFAEIEVNIGINDRWLTIMDSNFTETLLVQSLEEMTWQLEGTKENQTPFLILNLSCDEEIKEGSSTTINISNHATTLFLMVTGSQTLLIDALMNTMTGRRLERAISDSSSSDSSTSSAGHASLIQSRLSLKNCSASSNRKLCLAKFKDGKCTEAAGSFKAIYCQGQTI
ncbi:CRE-FRM-10 protein [Caenorhabditis remanei]|uniref:FERM domain-containing protein 8 n=1 Tax=Caenorhabditis remanei TaxID=31234 RepID=E3LPB7_CAERE|nr:CRE-FRM-10 protein [Caenorhabditis remanei]